MVVNAVRRKRKSTLPDPAQSTLLRLSDGRDIVIRPIAAADSAPIAAAFHLLTDEEVRRRFLHPLKALSDEHLQKLTHPTAGDEFALVAAEPDQHDPP